MSLDLLKNALYQALRADIPDLVVYPEVLPDEGELYPNLSFVVVDEETLGVREGAEWYDVPSGLPETDPASGLANPAFYRLWVIDRFRSKLRLQLRDNLGGKNPDESAFQRMRDRETAVRRFLSTTRVVTLGVDDSATFAELYFRGGRPAFDRASGVYLHEYEVDVDPWRLLAAGQGTPTFLANQITLEVHRQRDDRLLISRVYPLP